MSHTAETIAAFVTAAVADGWALRPSLHPDTGVPASVMGELSRDGMILNTYSVEAPIEVIRNTTGGPHTVTYPAQHWIKGHTARGWRFDAPETYDAETLAAAAAAAPPPV